MIGCGRWGPVLDGKRAVPFSTVREAQHGNTNLATGEQPWAQRALSARGEAPWVRRAAAETRLAWRHGCPLWPPTSAPQSSPGGGAHGGALWDRGLDLGARNWLMTRAARVPDQSRR